MYSLGDPKRVARVLDWRSAVKLPEIVERMIRAEQDRAGST
jgi:GDP-D-mannose dehydratase